MQLVVDNEEATKLLGRQIAEVLQPGTIISLVGDLGAGKTRLVQAIAVGLDVPVEIVNSPTFTLVQEYPGRIPLRHCDTYRLRDPNEFLDLGLDEMLAMDGVALIEWGDRVMYLLPHDVLRIEFNILSPTSRSISMTATGTLSRAVLEKLQALRQQEMS